MQEGRWGAAEEEGLVSGLVSEVPWLPRALLFPAKQETGLFASEEKEGAGWRMATLFSSCPKWE